MADAQISPLDHKVLALVKEATKGLLVLQKEVHGAVKNLNKGDVDPSKAQNAAKKVHDFMKKYVAVTKLQNSKAYDQLQPAVQKKYVDWMDGVMSDLLGTLNLLNAARPFVKKDPKKNFTYLIKSGQTYVGKYPSTPKGVGTLLKQIQKAGEADTPHWRHAWHFTYGYYSLDDRRYDCARVKEKILSSRTPFGRGLATLGACGASIFKTKKAGWGHADTIC